MSNPSTEPTATGRPRLLTIMGSGETAPTMAKVHRELIDRLGPSPVPAVMLDTPFGFQENAEVLAAKAVRYFAESVQRTIEVASLRVLGGPDVVAEEEALARLKAAAYVFAGPGSPTYALGQWMGTRVPDLLVQKLREGGGITFASAAAITLGVFALPVYEVYKVGQSPHWLPGLDLLDEVGLPAVVIPHFNNAEGGNHDTRYCYMGERRLRALEDMLPDEVSLLGVDEHTACMIDIDSGVVTVAGIGRVTVRARGSETSFGAGETVAITDLTSPGRAPSGTGVGAGAGAEAGAAVPARGKGPETGSGSTDAGTAGIGGSQGPLLDSVAEIEGRFDAALAEGDANRATGAVLELEATLHSWDGDPTQSDHADRGRDVLRSLVARLGGAASKGMAKPEEAVGPFVEALLAARARARADRRWDEGDELRDRLVECGVEINDTPDGTTWSLKT